MCFERVFNVFIQAADAVMAYIEAIGDRDVCAYDLVTALRRLPPTALPPLLARVLASPGGAKVCMCTDIYRYLPICTDVRCLSHIHIDMYRYVPICTDMYRYVPICTDMYRYIGTQLWLGQAPAAVACRARAQGGMHGVFLVCS